MGSWNASRKRRTDTKPYGSRPEVAKQAEDQGHDPAQESDIELIEPQQQQQQQQQLQHKQPEPDESNTSASDSELSESDSDFDLPGTSGGGLSKLAEMAEDSAAWESDSDF